MQVSPEAHLRSRISNLRFVPHTSPKHPTIVGFIKFTYDQTNNHENVGLHFNQKEYFISWPYWDNEKSGDRIFSIKPCTDEIDKAYVRIFVGVMKEFYDDLKARIEEATKPTPPQPTQEVKQFSKEWFLESMPQSKPTPPVPPTVHPKPEEKPEPPRDGEKLVYVHSFYRRYPGR